MILDLLPRDLRESIAGDLAEEYESVRRRRGRAIARVWFWWNAVRLGALFRWERVARGVAELDRDQAIGPIRPMDVPSSRATRVDPLSALREP